MLAAGCWLDVGGAPLAVGAFYDDSLCLRDPTIANLRYL